MPYDFDELPRFDLGLTMAGAVSAGAYTAGVIDFLIEALDAWESAKRAGDPAAPLHAVGLKAVSGASAGSVTGAILAAALRYDFPHIRQRTQALGDKNPLYDGWVNMIDIRQLLGRRDVAEGQAPVSLLDSTRLLEIARKAIDYGEGVATIERPYLGNPTRFIFTLTNLRGVPYAYTLSAVGGAGQDMSMHGDCMRFALTGLGRAKASPVRADEYQIAYPGAGTAKWQAWGTPFATAALASAAFPIGLAPRELARRVSDYEHVKVVVPEGGGRPAQVRTIEPAWNPVNPRPADAYRFVIVDGGAINNEPLELARVELCDGDPLARNDRDGMNAKRAVVMVDPFTGPDAPGPQGLAGLTLLRAGVSMFAALKNQARFKPEDVALAIDDTVYSRFLIAPVRSGAKEGNSAFAIACGSLGGFGGFMSQKFREHDFFLGRRNCQRFLERYLTLPEANPLFARWTDDQRKRYRQQQSRSDGSVTSELPIVPLMPPLHPQLGEAETLAAWPVGACDPGSLKDPIKTRLDAIYDGYVTEWLGLLLSLGWKFYLRPKITNFALGAIENGLRAHTLL